MKKTNDRLKAILKVMDGEFEIVSIPINLDVVMLDYDLEFCKDKGEIKIDMHGKEYIMYKLTGMPCSEEKV